MKEITNELIFDATKSGKTVYFFQVEGNYFGPYNFAAIALYAKAQEESRAVLRNLTKIASQSSYVKLSPNRIRFKP